MSLLGRAPMRARGLKCRLVVQDHHADSRAPMRARGLKYRSHARVKRCDMSRPHAGAWIEMPASCQGRAAHNGRAPMRARGLKFISAARLDHAIRRAPMRARGLKYRRQHRERGTEGSRPHAGAWIEI